jgi:FkbM family methyltransferase
MTDAILQLLKSQIAAPLVLIDAGAAGGSLAAWRAFGDKARIYCFEARENESDDLARANRDGNIEYIPFALSHDNQGIDLIVTSNLGCSSVYSPIERIWRRYPGCFQMRPISKVRCPSITIDQFAEQRGIERVHAIKLDTQGSELHILKGAEKVLRHCLFVLSEVEFNPLYLGQPLFCDLDRFLRDHGFTLWRLNGLAHYALGRIGGEPLPIELTTDPGSYQKIPVPSGQLFFGDALYVREQLTAVSNGSLRFDDAVTAAALAAQWSLWDLAAEVARKSSDEALLSAILALLDSSFAAPRGYYFPV